LEKLRKILDFFFTQKNFHLCEGVVKKMERNQKKLKQTIIDLTLDEVDVFGELEQKLTTHAKELAEIDAALDLVYFELYNLKYKAIPSIVTNRDDILVDDSIIDE